MRKIFLSLIAIVLFALVTNAQDDNRTFRLGVYGDLGTSWAKSKNDDYKANGISSAYGFGFLFDYYFTQNYVFNSGVYVDFLSGKLQYSSLNTVFSPSTGTMNRKYTLKYLEIPLNLKLKTNQIGYLTYFFQFGLNNGFRLKSGAEDVFDYTINGLKSSTEPKDSTFNDRFYKLSFLVGIGAEYEVNKSLSIFGQLNFNNGLNNFLGNVTTTPSNADLVENAILNKMALTVGLIF